MAPSRISAAILIRSRPLANGARAAVDRVRGWLGPGDESMPALVFFHGAGVDHALAGPSAEWLALKAAGRAELVVCETAWSRRHDHPPPDGWATGSLIGFWDVAAHARQLECLGLG